MKHSMPDPVAHLTEEIERARRELRSTTYIMGRDKQ